MLHDLDYEALPEAIKDILVEGDVASNNLVRLQDKMVLALQFHELIPDHRIELVRISNGEDYERIINVKGKTGVQTGVQILNMEVNQVGVWRGNSG